MKRKEPAFRDKNDNYQLLVDYSSDLIWNLSPEGLFLDLSPSWTGITGYRPASLVGRSFQQIVHPDDIAICFEYIQKLMDAQRTLPGPEYRVRHADGQWHWHNATCTPVIGAKGEFLSIVGVSRDITEKKRAERSLQRQNLYLELLNETALGLMRRTGLRDHFQAIVSRTVRFFGTDEGWIYVYHAQEDDFEYAAGVGQTAYAPGTHIAADTGISAEVWRTKNSVMIDDYQSWPCRDPGEAYRLRRATMAVALRYEGRLAGILGLSHHSSESRFEADDLAMLERLAELASVALDNARLYDRMKRELAERKQVEETLQFLSPGAKIVIRELAGITKSALLRNL